MNISWENTVKYSKNIAAIGVILIAITAVTGYTFDRPATMGDINNTELRLSQVSKFGKEEKLLRLQREKYKNWEAQYFMEIEGKPINPKFKEQEEYLNKEIDKIESDINKLNKEITQRTKA